MIRWAVSCAATQRKFRKNLDWAPYYEIADRGLPLAERLEEFGKLADRHFDTAGFDEFCAKHLPHLPEVAGDYFASAAARDPVRKKVRALYPEHEGDKFTDLFLERIHAWKRAELR
ncbi:MAG: hypothetical protein V2A76_05925 [Planctomycetota bacterium]